MEKEIFGERGNLEMELNQTPFLFVGIGQSESLGEPFQRIPK